MKWIKSLLTSRSEVFASLVAFAILANIVVQLSDSHALANGEDFGPHNGVYGYSLDKTLILWATYYDIPEFSSSETGVWIRDPSNKPMVKVNRLDFCDMAMAGTGIVDGVMYGYIKQGKGFEIECDYVPSGRARFVIDKNPYGTGVKDWPMIPFKTIAVDPSVIPYGSKVYIPEAFGVEYEFEGKIHVHDGIFTALDTGGLIKGNHIDVFLGARTKNPFDFVESTPDRDFEAWILKE